MKKAKNSFGYLLACFAIMIFGSAIPDVFSSEIAVKGMHNDLGYPLYLIPFIGIASGWCSRHTHSWLSTNKRMGLCRLFF